MLLQFAWAIYGAFHTATVEPPADWGLPARPFLASLAAAVRPAPCLLFALAPEPDMGNALVRSGRAQALCTRLARVRGMGCASV